MSLTEFLKSGGTVLLKQTHDRYGTAAFTAFALGDRMAFVRATGNDAQRALAELEIKLDPATKLCGPFAHTRSEDGPS